MTIDQMLSSAKSVAIFGHVRPDGDCIGSCLGLYNYIVDNYPNVRAQVFAEAFPDSFRILNGAAEILPEYDGREVDLAFLLDTPSFERCGAKGADCLSRAHFTCNVDHHVSNPRNLCRENFVNPRASSASEELYFLLDSRKVGRRTADCLYLGIVHDTGAFKFSCTGKRTMTAVGDLMDKGCAFDRIINETYYTRTYRATRITGFVLEHCLLALDGKVVYAALREEDLERFGVSAVDLGSVIDSLREVEGTEVAIFIYPVGGQNKISLRSNYVVDVNRVAASFGGGGHVRAAGASSDKAAEDLIPELLASVQSQMDASKGLI